ncbi:MAG: protein phosphatase 2C domain-containing protein [Caldilineaceae bacterium]
MSLAVLDQAPAKFSLNHAGVAGKLMTDSHSFFRIGTDDRDWQKHPQQSLYVAVVADGSTGETSQLVVETVERVMKQQPTDMPVVQRMGEAVRSAHQILLEASSNRSELRGMSATIVLAVIDGWQLYLAHLGTCRAYLIREGLAHRLTVDHTLLQEAIDARRVNEGENSQYSNRQLPLRYLGMPKNIMVDHGILVPGSNFTLERRQIATFIDLQPDDTILLCSNGLTDTIPDEELSRTFRQQRTKQAVRLLVNKAIEQREEDNITASALVMPASGTNQWLTIRGLDVRTMLVSAMLAFLLLILSAWAGYSISLRTGAERSSAPLVALAAPEVTDTPAATVTPEVTLTEVATNTATTQATKVATATQVEKTVASTPTVAERVQALSVSTTTATPATVLQASLLLSSTQAVTGSATVSVNVTATAMNAPSAALTQTLIVSPAITASAVVTAAPTAKATTIVSASVIVLPTVTPISATHSAALALAPPLSISLSSPFAVMTVATSTIESALATTSTPFPTSPTTLPTPAQVDNADYSVILQEPMESTLAGSYTFRWLPNFDLPNNRAFELVIWEPGGDPMHDAFSPTGVDRSTSVRVDLNTAALGTLNGILMPGRTYQWSIMLVDASQTNHRLELLAPGHGFLFKLEESAAPSVPTVAPPADTPTSPPPTNTTVPPTDTPVPPTDTPVPPPTDTPVPPTDTPVPPTDTPVPPTDTPVPPPTDTPVPAPTNDCPRNDPDCSK